MPDNLTDRNGDDILIVSTMTMFGIGWYTVMICCRRGLSVDIIYTNIRLNIILVYDNETKYYDKSFADIIDNRFSHVRV